MEPFIVDWQTQLASNNKDFELFMNVQKFILFPSFLYPWMGWIRGPYLYLYLFTSFLYLLFPFRFETQPPWMGWIRGPYLYLYLYLYLFTSFLNLLFPFRFETQQPPWMGWATRLICQKWERGSLLERWLWVLLIQSPPPPQTKRDPHYLRIKV